MAAGYHIERETDLHGDELRALPDDPAVAAAERDAACRAAAAARASEWHRLPRWLRRVVQGGAVAMVTSCYIVQFFSSSCFIAFEITDDIGEKLGGNALNAFAVQQIVSCDARDQGCGGGNPVWAYEYLMGNATAGLVIPLLLNANVASWDKGNTEVGYKTEFFESNR